MRDITVRTVLPRTDAIRRTTAPETTNGSRWEVQLSAAPPRAWRELFKVSADTSAAAALGPRRVVFERAAALFYSDADHVEEWVESIDDWIARTDTRHLISLATASAKGSTRADDGAKHRERIHQLNDRFKDL